MAQICFLLFLLICSILLSVKGNNTRQPNVTVRISNMTESMKQDAIRITKQGFIKFNGYTTKSRSSLAQYIRYEFDQLHQKMKNVLYLMLIKLLYSFLKANVNFQ